jgi:hypothetical protein
MLMCFACAFSRRRESPDMTLGDKSLISEVVLSQLVSEPGWDLTHMKASKNHNNVIIEEQLAHIKNIVVSLGGKLTFVFLYATTDLLRRSYTVIFGVLLLFFY